MKEKKRKRRKTGKDMDSFTFYVKESTGQKVRKEARRKGHSLSKTVGDVVEKHFGEETGKKSSNDTRGETDG